MQRKCKLFIYFLAVAAFVYMSCYTTFATGDTTGNESAALTTSDVISVPESVPEIIPSEVESEPESELEPVPSEVESEPESELEPVPSEVESEPEYIPDDLPSEVVSDPMYIPVDPVSSQFESQVVSISDPIYSAVESSPSYYTPDTTYSYSGDVVASLYDVSTVIDTNEMDAKDWNIVLDLESNSGKNENIGLSDFNFIKEDTGKTTGEDDSTWILYVGYTLVALGLAGILYVIVSTIYRIKHKDKYDKMLKERKAEGKQLKKSARAGSKQLKAGRYSN